MNPIRVVGVARRRQRSCSARASGSGAASRAMTKRRASPPRPSRPPRRTARKVLYWHDPMVPGQRFDKPGKSPFMDMPLVARVRRRRRAGRRPGERVAAAEPRHPHRDGPARDHVVVVRRGRRGPVRRAAHRRGPDARRRLRRAARGARADGARSQGTDPRDRVRSRLARAAERAPRVEERRCPGHLVAAARDRLRALSIPEELVQRSEQSGSAQARFALASPADGVVTELAVREGVAVNPGMTLFRIAGLETVWAVAEVPEVRAVRLVRGQKVKATLQADPSQTFEGELKEILPEVSSATRTLKARFEVDNKAGKLVPGNAAAPCGRRAAGRSAGRAVGSGHPYRQARGRDPARRRRSLRAARGRARGRLRRRRRDRLRPRRRRSGGRERPIPDRLRGAPARGARQPGRGRHTRRLRHRRSSRRERRLHRSTRPREGSSASAPTL